jgi:ribosomal protein S18 acetylase RimI-like enzyme
VATNDVVLREMVAADIDAGLRLCRASRWNQTARDWEQFLTLAPRGARVALRDGRVIGTVATLPYEDRFGWIGMVLVDPTERGHGVGTRLLHEGLTLLSGTCARLDATPAGRPLYAKLGFREEYGLARMQRPVAATLAPASRGVRSMLGDDLPAVSALERDVFGADRSAMLRWLLEGAPEYARVVEEAGLIAGYSFGRHGHDFEHVGPIVAGHVGHAAALAAACMAVAPERPLVIDAARHSPGWLAWLAAQGLTEQRPFFRMYKGRNAYPGQPDRQFAICGPEFG